MLTVCYRLLSLDFRTLIAPTDPFQQRLAVCCLCCDSARVHDSCNLNNTHQYLSLCIATAVLMFSLQAFSWFSIPCGVDGGAGGGDHIVAISTKLSMLFSRFSAHRSNCFMWIFTSHVSC